ncbi:unnamed protein product, partial [Choristocarpus tenellus]
TTGKSNQNTRPQARVVHSCSGGLPDPVRRGETGSPALFVYCRVAPFMKNNRQRSRCALFEQMGSGCEGRSQDASSVQRAFEQLHLKLVGDRKMISMEIAWLADLRVDLKASSRAQNEAKGQLVDTPMVAAPGDELVQDIVAATGGEVLGKDNRTGGSERNSQREGKGRGTGRGKRKVTEAAPVPIASSSSNSSATSITNTTEGNGSQTQEVLVNPLPNGDFGRGKRARTVKGLKLGSTSSTSSQTSKPVAIRSCMTSEMKSVVISPPEPTENLSHGGMESTAATVTATMPAANPQHQSPGVPDLSSRDQDPETLETQVPGKNCPLLLSPLPRLLVERKRGETPQVGESGRVLEVPLGRAAGVPGPRLLRARAERERRRAAKLLEAGKSNGGASETGVVGSGKEILRGLDGKGLCLPGSVTTTPQGSGPGRPVDIPASSSTGKETKSGVTRTLLIMGNGMPEVVMDANGRTGGIGGTTIDSDEKSTGNGIGGHMVSREDCTVLGGKAAEQNTFHANDAMTKDSIICKAGDQGVPRAKDQEMGEVENRREARKGKAWIVGGGEGKDIVNARDEDIAVAVAKAIPSTEVDDGDSGTGRDGNKAQGRVKRRARDPRLAGANGSGLRGGKSGGTARTSKKNNLKSNRRSREPAVVEATETRQPQGKDKSNKSDKADVNEEETGRAALGAARKGEVKSTVMSKRRTRGDVLRGIEGKERAELRVRVDEQGECRVEGKVTASNVEDKGSAHNSRKVRGDCKEQRVETMGNEGTEQKEGREGAEEKRKKGGKVRNELLGE